jgi:vacuolar-type H+-ATPase subunit C/Vma6
VSWAPANARARGLATHLLGRSTLLAAAEAGSWAAAARVLRAHGFPVSEQDGLTPTEFDRASGRVVADRLALLGRWLGRRRAALAVIYEEQERRTLRRMLRGAAQGGSPGVRLQGVNPTPGLPERALVRLARAESPPRLAQELIRLGHPAGRVLQVSRPAAKENELPALWQMEGALGRLFATRVTRAVRRAGPLVRAFARLLIDLENTWALLAASEWGSELSPDLIFLEGGAALDHLAFAELAAIRDRGRLDAALARHFRSTPFDRLLGGSEADPRLESRALALLVEWLRQEGRRFPLGPAVVLSIMLRIQAEVHDVRLVLGLVTLGAPRSAVETALVTAA